MLDSSRTLNPQRNNNNRRTESELSSPAKRGNSLSTRQVVEEVEGDGDLVYYLPCYVRFLVKEIKNVDAEGMEATVAGTLLFSFYYGNVDQELIQAFAGEGGEQQSAILLQFNQEDSIFLREDKGITRKEEEKDRIITYTVRQNFRANLRGNVFLTPFETLDICLSVIIQTVHLPKGSHPHKVSFKFNCMNSTEVDLISHGENLNFGYYRMACYHLEARYTNSRKFPFENTLACSSSKDDTKGKMGKSEKEDDSFRCYQYAHFRIPVYKYPGVSILTIFIPIWILGLIGLFVFFQQPAFGARLATVAVLALAFVAFMPTVNASIPKTPQVKLVDLLIVMELAAVILLLVQSFNDRFSENAVFDWQNSPLFLVSVGLNAATLVTVFMLFVIHKCIWERVYTREKETAGKVTKKLMRKLWSNEECDYEFGRVAGRFKLKNI